jgi:hypothetical protein
MSGDRVSVRWAFPNVILSRRDAVGGHWFEPIDRLDAQGREPPRSFHRAA